MNSTKNYHLNQWEASDRVLRTDFNADNQKIDTALEEIRSGGLRLITGSYTGDGEANRTIKLGTQPKAVYICDKSGRMHDNKYYYGGLALPDCPAMTSVADLAILEISSTGFVVHNLYSDPYKTYAQSNGSGTVYYYFVLL